MSSFKIMVVDDNSATRRMVRNALTRRGHDVIEAADGKTALELMQREHPRVVLQDLVLPDADGFALVEKLRALAGTSDVSILAFSGFVAELDAARASKVGFDDIIPKPIAPSRLVPIIEAHLPMSSAAIALPPLGAGRRLVVADDDPMQLEVATFRLSQLGFEVTAVSDGRAALDAMRAQAPDAVVAAVIMSGLDGFGLAMAMRREAALRQIPLLLVSAGIVADADRELARRAGATDLVPRASGGAWSRSLAEMFGAPPGTSLEPDPPPEPPQTAESAETAAVFKQLERQVALNTALAKRCSALASELAVLAGISEAVLDRRDVDHALDDALAECFAAGGIAIGALYLVDGSRLRVRPIGDGSETADLPTLFGHEELLAGIVRDGRTLYLPSTDLPRSVERSLLQHANASALLIVPLMHLGAPLGSLLMIARGRELDQEDWLSFAHGVATQITHVLALARAYAEREAAERKATEHAALLDAVMNNAPDIFARLDLDGTIRFVNRVRDPHTMGRTVGSSIFDFSNEPDQLDVMITALKRMRETGEPQGYDTSIRRADGTIAHYASRLGPVLENGVVTGAILVSRDVTEKKQTDVHLVLADRMASVGTLAAGVAHEINNPLASVIANLDMALEDVEALRGDVPPDLIEELKDARTASDRVREIVRDLKIFSRAEEDSRGPVDVEAVLDSTLRMAWNEIRHRAKLVKRYGGVPRVDVNESRLGQVFLNLIVNAAHAIPPGNYDTNQIRVSTSLDAAGRVVVSIADTGTGIPAHVQPRLFTPFYTTKPVGVGTGLGLAISLRIVQQFGGAIAYDTEVGKGTEFRVSLPVAEDAELPPERISFASFAPRRGTILVIDDEETLALAIKRFLSADHDVTAVTRASEALVLIERGARYDVILCDLMMPQITGAQLHADLMQIAPEQAARIVFLTGGAFTASAREFLDSVSNRRLDKPFELKELRKLVNQLVY
ncbi:MAG TPA: response regulator [Kofleriaceae bacterium]|jgi:PAS domain S-box-containing protein